MKNILYIGLLLVSSSALAMESNKFQPKMTQNTFKDNAKKCAVGATGIITSAALKAPTVCYIVAPQLSLATVITGIAKYAAATIIMEATTNYVMPIQSQDKK